MKTRLLFLYLLMVVQAVGLGTLYAYHATGRDAKWRLQFEAAPVDPRDFFRGDYIVLSYPGLNHFISHDDAKDKAGAGDGDRYVTLKQAGDYWSMDQILAEPPIDGHARLHGQLWEYGLERYYVPEGKGRPPGKIVVEAAVRPDGSAQIRQLFSDGHPWP